jgi:hypothetical protein
MITDALFSVFDLIDKGIICNAPNDQMIMRKGRLPHKLYLSTVERPMEQGQLNFEVSHN